MALGSTVVSCKFKVSFLLAVVMMLFILPVLVLSQTDDATVTLIVVSQPLVELELVVLVPIQDPPEEEEELTEMIEFGRFDLESALRVLEKELLSLVAV